jgi:hypothetical protein
MEQMREWHGMLTAYAEEHGYKKGWIYHQHKERFGVAPVGYASPIPPSPEVRSWVRSRNIAFAKSRQKERGYG